MDDKTIIKRKWLFKRIHSFANIDKKDIWLICTPFEIIYITSALEYQPQ